MVLRIDRRNLDVSLRIGEANAENHCRVKLLHDRSDDDTAATQSVDALKREYELTHLETGQRGRFLELEKCWILGITHL